MSSLLLENQAFVQTLVHRIEDNLAEKIDIVHLAKSFHISPWHFQRLFKSWVGDTLGGYIRGRRLTRAAELLLHSELGIIDIAFEVGFNSHEAFTRSFKGYFNCSPRAFRESRPQVRLNDKPILSTELVQHLAEDLDRDPQIYTRPAMDVLGLTVHIPSPFTQPETHCDTMYPLWMELLDRLNELPSAFHDTFLGMSMSPSGNFTEDELVFLAGVPVHDFAPNNDTQKIPTGMVHYHFPAQQVACFDVAVVDSDTVSKTMDYIYGYWLPNSPYQRGTGHDYEYFVNVEHFKASQLSSQYILPIVAR